MKKFIFRLLILAASIYIGQFVIYLGVKHILDAKGKFRYTRYFRHSKHRYYALGNSRAVNSVNEKYANDSLKADLINLGFNGEPYQNVINILDDINSKVKGSTIFFEVSCMSRSNRDYSYSYYISNSKFIKQNYQNTVYDHIALLRLNNEFFFRNIFYLNKSDNNWINGGTITKKIIDQIDTMKSANIFRNNTADFENKVMEVQNKCNKSGNKVIFYLSPYFPQYLAKLTDYSSTVNFFRKNSNIYTFVDLNNVKMTQDMFMDKIHSNFSGSMLLTRYLINYGKGVK